MEFWIPVIVLALFSLKALMWELERPYRQARWDRLIREAQEDPP